MFLPRCETGDCVTMSQEELQDEEVSLRPGFIGEPETLKAFCGS